MYCQQLYCANNIYNNLEIGDIAIISAKNNIRKEKLISINKIYAVGTTPVFVCILCIVFVFTFEKPLDVLICVVKLNRICSSVPTVDN